MIQITGNASPADQFHRINVDSNTELKSPPHKSHFFMLYGIKPMGTTPIPDKSIFACPVSPIKKTQSRQGDIDGGGGQRVVHNEAGFVLSLVFLLQLFTAEILL